MLAAVMYGAYDVRMEVVPDPRLLLPDDAIVRVLASCVCGSDLWMYRGETPVAAPRRGGHEFIGIVEEVGPEVTTLTAGDFVVSPFSASDNTCVHCRNGVTTSCVQAGFWGAGTDSSGHPLDGGQGEFVRVPLADGTLVATPDRPDAAQLPDLLALSDVMATGHHAAVLARVRAGDVVVVVGDGAVGLSGVLAARRLGADRIILMSRHRDRQAIGRAFGATDIVEQRGADGAAAVLELLSGTGADAALECVGLHDSMEQAISATRPGGRIGSVGSPHLDGFPYGLLFAANRSLGAGIAPVRAYLPELLTDVLDGTIEPGRVFDLELPLAQTPDAYAAMASRRSVKTMLRP